MGNENIPRQVNLLLWGLTTTVTVFLLLVMPLMIAPQYLYVFCALIILLIPLNTLCWSLIHEGIHRNLHPDKPMNEFMGRSLSIVLGNSFHVLRFGHMMHHQYNRAWESEIYPTNTPSWKATLNHYFKMLGGLYVIEVLLSLLLAISPVKYAHKVIDIIFSDEHHRQAVRQMLLKPSVVKKVRMDGALIVILYASSLYLYGVYGWFLALIVGGRAFIISLMDNAYHYGTPPDNSVPAKELHVPKPFATMILNFNYHMMHHKNASLPWTHLPEEHAKQNRRFDDRLIPALLAQFKGPINDAAFHEKSPS